MLLQLQEATWLQWVVSTPETTKNDDLIQLQGTNPSWTLFDAHAPENIAVLKLNN